MPKLDEITQPGSTGQLRDEERRRWEEMVAEAEIIMKELRALLKKGVVREGFAGHLERRRTYARRTRTRPG